MTGRQQQAARVRTLALADAEHNLVGLRAALQRVGHHQLPVVEHALRERLRVRHRGGGRGGGVPR